MSTPDPTQPSPADQTEVIGQRGTEEWPGDAAATEMVEQTGPAAPTQVVPTTEPTEGAAAGEGSPPEGATDPFGPPDSYGAPESGYYAASGDAQPFPQSEPTAEAPLGDFDFLPADTYEPDTDVAAPPLSTETVAVPVGSPAPPPPPPPPPPLPAAPEPPTAVPAATAQPADLPPVPVQSQMSGYSAPSYVPPAATVAAGAYLQAQQPAPEPQQPYGQQQYAQQPYGYGYGPSADPYAKSRVVAGVLGILLGGLGVHRFYLGYVGIGIAQIAVTIVTFGVGALWGFVEGILYLTQRTGSYSVDATGRPLRD